MHETMNVISPLDGSIISKLPLSNYNDVDKAVNAAKKAFIGWSSQTLKERVQVFFKYRMLLEKNKDELTKLIRLENGKIMMRLKQKSKKA
jgi:malonate-semialdehyde dehydrogenase (acetylating)/methylmalonate-semialdehyde dehydrogenase